jgi:hypothetical protein
MDGIDGQNGLNFYTVSGTPDNEFGEPGEGYIDYAASNLYVKDVYTFGSIVTGDEIFWSGDAYLESAGNATAFDYDNTSGFELTRDVWWGVDFGEQRTIRKMHIYMGGTEELHVEFHNDTSFTSPVDTYDHDYNTGSINEDIILLAPIVCRYVRFYISDRYSQYSNSFRHLGLLDTITATWDLKSSIIGPQGDSGTDGADGADGATWHVDTADPENSEGNNFDLWLTETDMEVFVKDVDAWSTDLALGKSATADSIYSSYGPSNAVDGNDTTEWRSSSGTNSWLQVDLGDEYVINRITFYQGTFGSLGNWELRASNSSDMSGYVVLESQNMYNDPWRVIGEYTFDFTDNQSSYRYYRFHSYDAYNNTRVGSFELYSESGYEWRSLGTISGSSGTDGTDGATWYVDTVDPEISDGKDYDLWLTETDKDIFVKDAPSWSTDQALSKSVTTNSESNPNWATNAVDGNSGTRWAAAQSIDAWIQVDLGTEYQINRIGLRNGAVGSLQEFEVRASNSSDNSGYEVLYSGTHDDSVAGTYTTYDFLLNTNTYQYYRVYCDDTASINNVSISDLELFSADALGWRNLGTISGSPGVNAPDTFVGLSDTPTTYSGAVGKYLRATASGIEFVTLSGVSSDGNVWYSSNNIPLNSVGSAQDFGYKTTATDGAHDIYYKTGFEADGWSNSISIIIDGSKVSQALYDFPVLLNLSASSGLTGEDVTDIFSELGTNSKKLSVVTQNGTECPVEIEYWNNTNSEARLWVKVPVVASSVDTALYLLYDNTQADNTTYVGDLNSSVAESVWDTYYSAVYHLSQDPTGTIYDSTSNNNDGTPANLTAANSVSGTIGMATSFTEEDDAIDIGASTNFHGAANFTVEAFATRFSGSTNTGRIFTTRRSSTSTCVGLWFDEPAAGDATLYAYNNRATSSVETWDDDTWRYWVVLETDTDVELRADRTSLAFMGAGLGSSPSADTAFIGSGWPASTGSYLNGAVQELRFSTVVRSDAWLEASDYSIKDELITFDTSAVSWNKVGELPVDYSFTGLPDTPTTYSGIEGNYLRVTASGIQAIDGIILTAPDLSEWAIRVTVSGVLYTEAV